MNKLNPAEKLAHVCSDMAIEMLKDQCTPKLEDHYGKPDQCIAMAPNSVKDDWGDSCSGYRCWGKEGHSGKHMTGDGANGYVYW